MKKLLTTLAVAIGLAASTFADTINLANVTADRTLNNGDVIYGTLSRSVKISIADGATVTLSNATINISGNSSTQWPGLTCDECATIILYGSNTVSGFYNWFPGIFVGSDGKLTIKGNGSLVATGREYAAGIGGSGALDGDSGDIVIEDGKITAVGGGLGAGIGAAGTRRCGNITISGGEITATGGGMYSAGIGGPGSDRTGCGSIVITGGTVNATGGSDDAPGIGTWYSGCCGVVYIGKGVKEVKAVGGIKCSLPALVDESLIDETVGGTRTITSRVVNLADITANTVIEDGKIITGTLGGNYKISIADGATVTLRSATINGVNDDNCKWAGLTCAGDATIILEGNNRVTGFYEDYPGIYVPVDGCRRCRSCQHWRRLGCQLW